MSVSKFNPNRDVDGIELDYRPDPDHHDRMRIHRSNSTGRLVLNCYEKTSGGGRSIADLVFDPEDAIALARWILEKFIDKKDSWRCAVCSAIVTDPEDAGVCQYSTAPGRVHVRIK